jgi:polyisoprenoid-binding protein YceI
MKKLFLNTVVLSSLILPFALKAEASERYVLDESHTQITWHANHFGFSTPSGKFVTVKGTVVLDEGKPEDSMVEVEIATKDLSTGIDKFDAHLKGADFLNVEQFPKASFKSEKVELTGKDTAKVHGKLTLMGIIKPVVLEVKKNKIGVNSFTQKKTAGFSAKTTLKRSDFGISYGIPGVADEVLITIEAEANVEAQ